MHRNAGTLMTVIGTFLILAFTAMLIARQGNAARQQTASTNVQMIPVDGEGAKYWSRWRGPSGQGLVTGSGYPDKWSPTENVLWKKPVPGSGNSSPVVWGDRIFLTTAYDGGKRLSVLAFQRSTPLKFPIRYYRAIHPSNCRTPEVVEIGLSLTNSPPKLS